MPDDLLLTPMHFVWLPLIGFAAGFLDSIVGGGGLIGTPAMLILFPNQPILSIIGTNRTSSIFGTSVAAWNYFRYVKSEWHILLPACGGAFASSYFGVLWAKKIPSDNLKLVVLIAIIALAIYSFFNKGLGQSDNRRHPPRAEGWLALAVGSGCGFYNGLIGPGTGTLLVFGFVSAVGLDFLKSSAVAKAANVAADISSFTVLLLAGYVMWGAAVPLVIGNMLGSYAGSKLAILKGSQFIRRFFLIVVLALIARTLWQVALG